MAAETETVSEPDFDRVNRVRGLAFKYLSFLASVGGIVALGVLLAYVAWDAFGLDSAEPAWYGALAVFVVLPTVAFLAYARRDPLAGHVALEHISVTLGGLLGGFGVFAILDIIAGANVWFAYFMTVPAPIAGLLLYTRARSDVNWAGLAILGVALAGPVVGTLGLGLFSRIGGTLGDPGIYFLTVVVPGAAIIRYVVGDYLELGDGDYAAAGMIGLAVLGVPLIDSVPWLSRTVWLIFLTTLVVPVGVTIWHTIDDRQRWPGLAGPAGFVLGVGLLLLVTDALGITGPSPWFDWQFITAVPSRTPEEAGLYPAIIGSVFIIVFVALITLFLAVGAALFLEEYAPSRGVGGAITRLIRINISNLAGVPSVVYGLLGLAFFANTVGLGFGTVITAALTLSLLILPIVIISAREAISSVPDSLRQASYGMGATRWQTIRRVVLPRAIPGILTGTILALGRAIGETAPLIMVGVATTQFNPPAGIFSKTTAMPMQIFSWSDYAQPAFQYGVVAAGIVTLLIVLLTMNSIAILLRNKFETENF
jgi:phosphate transport system permease protein